MSSEPEPSLPKAIAIIGPTASGKTALAVALAEEFDGEIISADSRQIYRGMDIGTAKPTAQEMRAIPHHLIDIKDPNEEYTAAEYKRDAIAAMREIISRGKLPIIAGGTGLYVSTVIHNFDIPHVEPNPALRKQLEDEIVLKGPGEAFKKLVSLDPEAAYIVDPKNPRRIVRALEVALATGKPFTASRLKNNPLFRTCMIGLAPDAATLRARIDRRVDQMMADGLLHEVKQLVLRYGASCKPLDAIGYRELMSNLEGRSTLSDAIALIKTDTRQYARRQMQWFKKEPNVHWIKTPAEARSIAHAFLKNDGMGSEKQPA